jgi:N-hydroxyarylamine O-acetyltransferase
MPEGQREFGSVAAVPDLDALLGRIGLFQAPPPTIDGLRTLHRAYVSRVPYEALAVQLEEFDALDLDTIQARLLAGRGGYCFELNGILGWMLEELGFDVQRREAVVGARVAAGEPAKPTNHLALVVTIGDERWLADAGLGEGPLEPLPLTSGRHAGPASSPLHWTLQQEDGVWWIAQHPWGSVKTFHVTAAPVQFAAFQPHHERLSTDPASSFVQTLVVQRPLEDRIVTLRARTLSVDGPRRHERRVLADEDAFATTLREVFDLNPDALGSERVTRLWARAYEQHEAHLAAAPNAVR